jgi:FtsP/CotA-like multicopper oxidase with cupredoxin domain
MKRRSFLQLAGGAGLLSTLSARRTFASVQVAQTALPGHEIPKYVEPLPTFFGARVAAGEIRVSVEEFQQKVLPTSMYTALPAPFNEGTFVWGYKVGNAPPSYPGFTIEARRGTSTKIVYRNNLPLPPFLQKYLTVDQTLDWADPLKQQGSFSPYVGPPPIVTHLHGGEVPSEFDGGPLSWFTPGLGLTGPAFKTNIYSYPNEQEATTLWFHDHTMGITRLNVYAGLAGFYLLRDQYDLGIPDVGLNLPASGYEIEMAIQDRQFDTQGQWLFPDGHPPGLNGPPPNLAVHPFWIPEFFGDVMLVNGKTWPHLNVEPRRYRFRVLNGCNARFLELRLVSPSSDRPGPVIWQIGTDGGLLDRPVALNNPGAPRARRLFLANGERADIIIDFAGFQGEVLVLRNSANAPYPSGDAPDPNTSGQVMQFRINLPLQDTDTSFDPAQPGTTLRGRLRQPPAIIRLAAPDLGTVASGVVLSKRRQLVLVEVEGAGGPLKVLVNNTEFDGKREGFETPIPGFTADGYGNWLSELPKVGSTEVWEIINITEDAHPIHLHLVQFQLANRQQIHDDRYREAWSAAFPGGAFLAGYGPPLDYSTPNADGAVGGNPPISPFLRGPRIRPEPGEAGWKDTIKVFPGEVTRIVVRWAPQDVPVNVVSAGENFYPFDPTAGPGYVWHCHILDHEDNEMMRPYRPA